MATEEQIEKLRQRAQGLGLNPKRPAINKLAAAVDSAVGGTKIPLSGRGRTNAAILTDIASKLESMRQGADLASPGLTAVGSPSEDSEDDDEFEDPLAQTPSSAPTEVGIPEGTPPAGWGGAVWNAAKGAAGLLGVPGEWWALVWRDRGGKLRFGAPTRGRERPKAWQSRFRQRVRSGRWPGDRDPLLKWSRLVVRSGRREPRGVDTAACMAPAVERGAVDFDFAAPRHPSANSDQSRRYTQVVYACATRRGSDVESRV